MATQKTVVVLAGPTGPTGTIKGVNILANFTGASGRLAQWLQATGASGPNGLLEKVYNIGPTGITGEHKSVIITGFSGSTGAAPSFTAYDPATAVQTTLSNGNRTLVSTGTAGTPSGNIGAKGLAADAKATGKYYFEDTFTVHTGSDYSIGVGTIASTLQGMGDTGGVTGCTNYFGGTVWSGGSNLGGLSIAATAGDTIGIAFDAAARLIWFKNVTQNSNWNFAGTANPATGVGGAAIAGSASVVPFGTFGFSNGQVGDTHTTNFGQAAFVGAVPAGFTSGWTTGP